MILVPDGKRFCGARLSLARQRRAIDRAQQRGDTALVKKLLRRFEGVCRRHPVKGGTRCPAHGGYSCGPVSELGKVNSLAARVAGRALWVAKRRAQGLPIGSGRRKGSRNLTPEQRAARRAEADRDKGIKQSYGRIARQIRADRRARRDARREERKQAAELDRRREQFHAGQPFWDDAVDLVASDPGLALKLEACFEAALTFFRDHGGAGRKAERDLARDVRTFIKHLNSPHPPPHEAIERVYDRLVRCEQAFGPADGKATRLERLQREYDNYLRRRAVDAAVKKVAMARAAAATERDSPPPGLTPSQNNRPDGGSATPVAVQTPQDVLQRAREVSEAIKRAGQYAGAARRGERLCLVLP
jgi:hypothetical protein